VAEETNHTRLVEPGTQDENAGIDCDQDKDPATEGVDDRPGAALLLTLLVTSLIDGELQRFSCFIVREGSIDKHNVVEGGVLPLSVVVVDRVVKVVLDHQNVAPG